MPQRRSGTHIIGDVAESDAHTGNDPSHPSHPDYARIAPVKAPYYTPQEDGRCMLMEMPEEVMVRVLGMLGRQDTARCMRVSGVLSGHMSTSCLLNNGRAYTDPHSCANPSTHS